MRSFRTLAAEPGAPLKPQPANGRDAMHWLRQASVKLNDAQQTVISANTRMDAAWGRCADGLLGRCLCRGLARHQR